MKNKLNVLLIDSDTELANKDTTQINDEQERMKEQAKLLSHYFIITRNNGISDSDKIILSDNLSIFPTRHSNRITFIYEALHLGRWICKNYRIDCICCRDPYYTGLVGCLLKKKFKIPLNIYIDSDIIDNPYFLNERGINIFLNKLAKWVIRRPVMIRVTASKEKEKLIKLGIEKDRIWYVPSFIDFNLFLQANGNKIRSQYLSDGFDRIVLFVGRLVKQKDLSTLIKAVPLVIEFYSRCLFLIIGKGPEEKKIKDLVLKLKVSKNICFVGYIENRNIPDYFSACDVFVNTSLYEGTCRVLLEAALSKKPIVSTKTTGACDAILDGQTGYLVDFGDSQQLAQSIVRLLRNPELAREMGEREQRYVLENFSKERILKGYLKVWEETVNYRNKKPGTSQKKKLQLTLLLKHLGLLSYAKKIKRIYSSFILRKRYIKFYIKPDTRKSINLPLSYTFEPTLHCNLNCNFCYEKDLDKEKNEMSLEQTKQAFNALDLDDQIINLTGGEIFVREDIFEILEYFKERNVWSYIVTNGTLFTEDIVNNLLKYNIRGIEFSLDGPEDVHNQIRNSKDAFERLIEAIKLTKDKFRISVNCVIQERNNIDSLIEIVSITHNLKIKELNFQPEVFTTSEALAETRQILGWDNLLVSLQIEPNLEYDFPIEIWEEKWNEVKRTGKRLGMDINIYPSLFDRHTTTCVQRKLRGSNLRLMCDELLNGRIDPYGNVIPCYVIRKSFGNLLESSFEEIWNSQNFREFRYKMAVNNLLPICENCCKLRLI